MRLIDVIKIFAESLGMSLVGVCGVGILFLLVISLGCSMFGGDEGAEKKDDPDDDDRTLFG